MLCVAGNHIPRPRIAAAPGCGFGPDVTVGSRLATSRDSHRYNPDECASRSRDSTCLPRLPNQPNPTTSRAYATVSFCTITDRDRKRVKTSHELDLSSGSL